MIKGQRGNGAISHFNWKPLSASFYHHTQMWRRRVRNVNRWCGYRTTSAAIRYVLFNCFNYSTLIVIRANAQNNPKKRRGLLGT